jgi:hypothetical protein
MREFYIPEGHPADRLLVYLFQAERSHGRHLRDVLARFRPMKLGGVAGVITAPGG